MPQFYLPMGSDLDARAFSELSPIERGYIEAMFFTSTGPDNEDEQLGEGTSFSELSPQAIGMVQHTCGLFADMFPDVLDQFDGEQVGRDLWFTSNGHGVGFWDRDADTYATEDGDDMRDLLTDRARKMSGRDLYRGDDGELYLV